MPKVPPYSMEFKREAVKLLRSGERTVPVLARELGVSQGSLRTWSAQLDADEGKTEGLSSAERDELKRLRREVKGDRLTEPPRALPLRPCRRSQFRRGPGTGRSRTPGP
jgi:transposase